MRDIEFYLSKVFSKDEILPALAGWNPIVNLEITGMGGAFPCRVKTGLAREAGWREAADRLQQLADDTGCEILTDDEGISPYQFIYFRPGKMITSVIVDPVAWQERSELIIDYYYSAGWGSFALVRPMIGNWDECLLNLLSELQPGFKVAPIDFTLVNRDFLANHRKLPELENFRFHYLLLPPEESKWYSTEEKTAHTREIMQRFHQLTGEPVCLFTVTSSIVENIPGGSDREEHCFLIRNGNTEKIIYKERRASW